MNIENKFELKQAVVLKTDPGNLHRIVIGIKACVEGSLLYELAQGKESSWHYECEISSDIEVKEKIGFTV